MPDDWDEDMDGEWEPPMVDNPEYKGNVLSIVCYGHLHKKLLWSYIMNS